MLIAALFTRKCGIDIGVSQQMNVQRKHNRVVFMCVFYHKKKEIMSISGKYMQLGDHVK